MNESDSMDNGRGKILSPRLAHLFSLTAELLLLLVTLAIIAAMWLPGYLSGRPGANGLDTPRQDTQIRN